MIDLLILYVLKEREYTMYGIQKRIKEFFAPYTNPSFGALKPSLRRLEENGFITSRQMMSDGGKLSGYYSRTKSGLEYLKKLLLEDLSENPLQFISNAKIKLSCAEVLDKEDRAKLFFHIKSLALSFQTNASEILGNEYTDLDFYQKILLDNTVCEYKNFITIIEGLEKDNGRNS